MEPRAARTLLSLAPSSDPRICARAAGEGGPRDSVTRAMRCDAVCMPHPSCVHADAATPHPLSRRSTLRPRPC
eukprot:5180912-Prymnesium_polylepis.1